MFKKKSKNVKQKLLTLLVLCFCLPTQIIYPQSLKKKITLLTELDQKVILTSSQTKNILVALQNQNNGRWSEALRSWKRVRGSSTRKKQFIFQNMVMLNRFRDGTNEVLSEKSALFLANYLIWQKKWDKSEQILNKINKHKISNQGATLSARLNLYLGKYGVAKGILGQIIPESSRERMELDIINIWIGFLTGNQDLALRKISEFKKKYLYIKDSLLVPHGSLNSHQMARYPWLRSLVIFPDSEEFLENIFWRYWIIRDLANLKPLITSQNKLLAIGSDVEGLSELLSGKSRSKEQSNSINKSEFLTPKYIEGRIEIARINNDWITFKRLVDQYIKYYPELKDGKHYLVEYLQHKKSVGNTQKP